MPAEKLEVLLEMQTLRDIVTLIRVEKIGDDTMTVSFRDTFLAINFKVQSQAKRPAPSLVNFVPAPAHHLYLALPVAFTQPGAHLSAEPCIAPQIHACLCV